MGWWMFLSDLGKCVVFLKLGCHQSQNCASHESVCEDHWVHLCLVLFVLTEVFAVFQAIHASGKCSRNNSVRPSACFQSFPNVVISGLSLADPLKMLGLGWWICPHVKGLVAVFAASPCCSELWLRVTLCSVWVPARVWFFYWVFFAFFYRFEKLAQGCKKDMEILQLARAQGMDPPSHHFEERTFKMIRCGKTKGFLRQAGMIFLVFCPC